MKTRMEMYEWMRADALKQIERLTDAAVTVEGTAEHIAALRDEIRQIDEAIRKTKLH
jgi:hypothetical protein